MLDSKIWRLNNLYRVINKDGDSVPFKLKEVQEKVIQEPHKRKLILKARQLGMSTLAVLDMLDDTLFTENLATGIVSYSIEHAQHIFKRIIGHALDTFPKELKPYVGIETRSAREITFSNGSFLRVDTTLRGGTYQNILVSEFGKTCARTPMKAEEVVTGTLNALPIDGKVIIESTGEGIEGYFAEMCLEALRKQSDGKELSKLNYKLLFYPWFDESGYRLSEKVDIDVELTDYFNGLEKELGMTLDKEQRAWYAIQVKVLGDKLKQEYPSTPMESFLSRSDAYYFAEYVDRAYKENRCLYTSLYDPLEPVFAAMDIGVNDLTVIIYFQVVHGEIRVIDYYADSNKGADFYAKHMLSDKQYLYHTIFLPHDSVKREASDVVTSVESTFRKLFSSTGTQFKVLARTDKQELISYAKSKFNRCVFNVQKVKGLLDKLYKYRKKWHEPTGRYLEVPQHSIESNFADAFQYMTQGVGHIESGLNYNNSYEKHKIATANRRHMI